MFDFLGIVIKPVLVPLRFMTQNCLSSGKVGGFQQVPMYFDYKNVVDKMPMLGSGEHPGCFGFFFLPEKCVEIVFYTLGQEEFTIELIFPTPSFPIVLL